MKIYLLRHGQTAENLKGVMLGSKLNVSLSEFGIKQIKDIKLDPDFDVIFSSPMRRTLETAEIVNQALHTNIVVTENLRERDKGILEGKTHAAVKEYTKGAVSEEVLNQKLEFDFSPYGGDSVESVRVRVKSFIQEVLDNYRDKKVLAVTHLGIVRVMFSVYAGRPPQSNDNAAVNVLDIGE